MSTKYSHRKKNLQLSYSVHFNLTYLQQPDDKERKIRCRLSMETLTPDEKDAINSNVENIAASFFEVLAPHLGIDPTTVNACEKRKLAGGQPDFMGDV